MKKTFLALILLLTMVVWSACRDDDPTVELTEFHLTANLGGDTLIVLDQGNLPAQLGFYSDKDSIGIDGVDCAVSYQAQFRDIGNINKQGFFFTFNRYFQSTCSNEPEDFRTLFLPEIQPVASSEDVRGWIFLYRDENGVAWSSLDGDQSNHQLSIISSESIPDDTAFGFRRQKIRGTLSCTLYDQTGNSLSLSNGEFSIYIVSYDW
jgi:hypothetical protein